MTELFQNPWVHRVVFVLGGLMLGFLVERLVIGRARRFAANSRFKWDDLLVASLRGLPTVWLTAAGVSLAVAVGEPTPLVAGIVRSALMIVVIGSLALATMRLAGGAIETFSFQSGGAIASPTLVVNLAKGAVALLALFIILQNLGINITPLITALGIGGLAVALALQDTLGNLFAGVHIILSRQVRPRDYVKISTGEEGWVTDVKGRNTTIQTFPDGNLLAVPNSVLASSIVKNYTLPQPALWVTVSVGVAYDSDLEHVERVTRSVALEVLEEIDGGVRGQQPAMVYQQFGASSIDFDVRLLVREFTSQGPVRHAFIKKLHKRFGEEGIEIPFPIRTLVMKQPRALAAPPDDEA